MRTRKAVMKGVIALLAVNLSFGLQNAHASKIINYHIVMKTADVHEAGTAASAYVKFYGTASKNGYWINSPERNMGAPSRNRTQTYTMSTTDIGVPKGVRLDLSKGLWMGNNWKVQYVAIYRDSDQASNSGGGYAEWIINSWHNDDSVWYEKPSTRIEANVTVDPDGSPCKGA